MRILFFVAVFLLLSNGVVAQKTTIYDCHTNRPLEMVVITSLSPDKVLFSNSRGEFDVSPLVGSTKIEFRHIGYKTEFLSYAQLQANKFSICLKEDDFSLDEVVVSATRWRQSSNKIPQKIVHISEKTREVQNPQTAADLLHLSGKVHIQKSQQGGGSPMIRGFSANRLLYAIDGVRMNNAIFRAGNVQQIISLDPLSVENVEVLFGSGSVIYGSDAIGGVMSFRTLQPQFATDQTLIKKGTTLLRYSSANTEKTAHADLRLGWKKWATISSFSTFNYNDLMQGQFGNSHYLKKYLVITDNNGNDQVIDNPNPNRQTPSGYSQLNFMQKIAFKPSPEWELTLNIQHSKIFGYDRYDRHLRTKKELPRYAEWRYGNQIWSTQNLTLLNTNANNLYDQMTIRIARQYFEESRITRNLNSTNRTTRTETVKAYSLNADFKKTIWRHHSLYYGTEWILNDVTSKGIITDTKTNTNTPTASRYPQARWQSFATYGNFLFRMNRQWSIQTGIRYSHFLINGHFDPITQSTYQFPFNRITLNNGATTGSLGFVFRPTDTWLFSSNLSTGFRAPNIDDMGKIFDSTPGNIVVPNERLKAEYAKNIDLSIAKTIRQQFKIELTGYYTLLTNALVRRDFSINGKDSIIYQGEMSNIQALQNATTVYVWGIQASFEWKLPYHLHLSSDFNFQKGRETMQDGVISPSRHAPPPFGTSKISYTNKRVTIQFYANYQAEKKHSEMAFEEREKNEIYPLDSNGNTYSPAWLTINLKSRYQLNTNWILTAGIENITNRRYRTYSSGISNAGINIITAVKYQF